MKRASRYLWLTLLLVSVGVLGDQASKLIVGQAALAPQIPTRVMTIGGSVAHGWKDTSGGGYLPRSFISLQQKTHNLYHVYDRTIVGSNGTQLATMYKGDYQKWFESVRPQIVVISWGILNDALPRVPFKTFNMHIHDEIADALGHHAIVFIVTPPVTKASYTQFKVQQPEYLHNEIVTARSFHSPNVYVFDVFDQMKAYLVAHHQTYVPYMADGWHPNTKGHILAGHLLYQDMLREFGNKIPHFISSPTGA